MISDSVRGIALWCIVAAALAYGVFNTLTKVVELF
ncbi:MFS transporter small subunit [Solirubrobacter phytolaccae]